MSGSKTCSFIQANVECPYYRGDDGKHTLTCEGLLPGSTVTTRFRRRSEWGEWIGLRCGGAWDRCPFAALAGMKYEETSGI